MKAKVIKKFRCLQHGKIYRYGDIYEDDTDRLQRLKALGYLDDPIEEEQEETEPQKEAQEGLEEITGDPEPVEPAHVGGGWYELPGGERIKGKEEALKALGGE